MLALFVKCVIICALHSNQYFSMSKRNKKKNYHKQQTPIANGVQKSQEEEKNPISLDEHLAEMELQSMSASSSGEASTTIAKAADVAPVEVQAEERPEPLVTKTVESKPVEKMTDASAPVVAGERKRVLVFAAGVLLGALITSLLI